MKIYGNCPKCNHNDRYISLLPEAIGDKCIYGITCLKCKYEEIIELEDDEDDEDDIAF